eukprot:CAMPEP_0180680934 /NCGR_PEP_ID=MMETSP1037_2-20121125/69734_1 /TAXON_ID=632150 /ORGANISM="Azadinium spinosum, Strain 3D9" /LENGTH=311 /DNA_ID=CAMNT_0022710785 /DNA_START=39 /DNA_END=972 /DNA_ORIENTATION=+
MRVDTMGSDCSDSEDSQEERRSERATLRSMASGNPSQTQMRQRLRHSEMLDSIADMGPPHGFKFSFICFSGVDDSVSPRTLCDISQEFSFIEWGVNFCAEKQGKEPRYASLAWLGLLREEIAAGSSGEGSLFTPVHFAAHLGGEYCVDVMKGHASLVRTLWEDYGFLRVQLSPTRAHGVNSSQLGKYLASFRSVIIALPQVEFVLEVSKETRGLSFALMDDPQPNLAFFFNSGDEDPPPSAKSASGSSGGAAPSVPKRPPPCPHPGVHIGYGGGITVDNLCNELRCISATVDDPKRPVWVELESGLRSKGP